MLVSALIIILVLFFVGACVGSFLNVIIYRSTTGESWVNCGKKIAWYDNIPLFSYIFLGGKCRHCKDRLSISHPVVESLLGLLFVWWYFMGSLFFKLTQQPFVFLQPMFWLLVGILLLFILIIDYRYYIISDTAVFVLTCLVVVYRIALVAAGIMQLNDLLSAVSAMAGSVLFFWLLWFLTKGKGFGFGDVKLAVPLGLLVGWPEVIIWLFSSFWLGAIVGIILIMLGKAKFGKPIPFGPFLIIGTLISLIWGNQLIGWYATLIL
jgi:leader peptidase (prepilin peptidase)/N-methyltransferase